MQARAIPLRGCLTIHTYLHQSRAGLCPCRARGHWDYSVHLVCERTRGAGDHPARRRSERPCVLPTPHRRGRRRHRHRRRQQHRRDRPHDSRHCYRGSEKGEAGRAPAVLHLLFRVRAGPSLTILLIGKRGRDETNERTQSSERGSTETTRRPSSRTTRPSQNRQS